MLIGTLIPVWTMITWQNAGDCKETTQSTGAS